MSEQGRYLYGNTVTVPVMAGIGIEREAKRGKCRDCRLYRVLYRVVVATQTGGDMTDARCAECWGIRESDVDGTAARQDDAHHAAAE